jgi:hypothetical protein
MPFATGITLYTFATITFARIAESGEVVPWFFPELLSTKDPLLGIGAYLDIGSYVAPTLTFRASCLSEANRTTLRLALGTTGTMTSTSGPYTGTVTMVKAIPVNEGSYRSFLLDVGFEAR